MRSRYEQFAAAISCIYRDIQRIQRQEMARFGLKGAHAQCLLALSRHPQGIPAARLSDLCEKDKAAISRTVAELEQAGLVCREEKASRYRARLLLTQRGRDAAQAVDQIAARAVEQADSGMNEQERAVFYGILNRIAENLHTVCLEGVDQRTQEV